jgi:hypothetical protein
MGEKESRERGKEEDGGELEKRVRESRRDGKEWKE